jgi:hypothetical protein
MTTDSERLAVIEETVKEIKKRLFGEDIDEGEIGHIKARITRLENWRWWVVGIAVGLGVTVGGFGKSLLESILK